MLSEFVPYEGNLGAGAHQHRFSVELYLSLYLVSASISALKDTISCNATILQLPAYPHVSLFMVRPVHASVSGLCRFDLLATGLEHQHPPAPLSPRACRSSRGWKHLSHPQGPLLGSVQGCRTAARCVLRAVLLEFESWLLISAHPESDVIHFQGLGMHIVVLNSALAARDLLDKRSSIYSDR